MLERGEQRPWSPADLIGVPRELRSNGERRSDGALYFGMPKSFSEVRDDEGYQPLRPKCRMRSTAVPSRNAQSPLEQIVRSEAKISTVSSGADRSERSGDKKGEKKFWDNKLLKNNEQARFLKINNGRWPITRSLAEFKVRRIFGRNANFRKFWDYYRLPWTD